MDLIKDQNSFIFKDKILRMIDLKRVFDDIIFSELSLKLPKIIKGLYRCLIQLTKTFWYSKLQLLQFLCFPTILIHISFYNDSWQGFYQSCLHYSLNFQSLLNESYPGPTRTHLVHISSIRMWFFIARVFALTRMGLWKIRTFTLTYLDTTVITIRLSCWLTQHR